MKSPKFLPKSLFDQSEYEIMDGGHMVKNNSQSRALTSNFMCNGENLSPMFA
ncbi:hypothetical protein MTR_2g040840 [Medicago truncatula]|uniref:Uncharacterized protein n=1 Tax=Medicago truncatula TaxID=3880 RepID=A0A072V6R7_MEDTR|nr:hypothetical protein MTR_2g040840 [Medicago truncatula]